MLLADYKAGETSSAQTVIFHVEGMHPLLRVLVTVFFQPNASDGAVPSSLNTWTVAPVVTEGSGQRRPLQNVFTDRACPDGYEFNTACEALRATCSFKNPSGEQGKWFARLRAAPAPGALLSEAELDALMGDLKIEAPPKVALLGP